MEPDWKSHVSEDIVLELYRKETQRNMREALSEFAAEFRATLQENLRKK